MDARCGNCGSVLPEGSLFCPECGQRVPERQQEPAVSVGIPAAEPAGKEPAGPAASEGAGRYPLLTNVSTEYYNGERSLPTELRHTFLFLEEGDWNSAARYLVWAGDRDPENPYLLLAQVMSDLGIRDTEELRQRMNEVREEKNYELFLQALRK